MKIEIDYTQDSNPDYIREMYWYVRNVINEQKLNLVCNIAFDNDKTIIFVDRL